MLSGIRRLIGSIRVVEEKGIIHISGLPANIVSRDIVKIWASSKISDNMFNHIGRSQLSFHSFFAPDVVYTLQKIITVRGSKRDWEKYDYRALAHVVELILTQTWMKSTTEDHPPILKLENLKRLKKSPLEGQLAFLKAYNELVPKYKLKGFMLAADPGTGKTIAGLMLGACLETDVNIFVVPKSSIDLVWRETLDTELVKPERTWYSSGKDELTVGYKNYVFHYEQLERALTFFTGKLYRKPMLWLDESHNLNEMDTGRSKLFVQLVKVTQSQHVVWASGTPLKAVGKEVIPFLDTTDSMFTPEVRDRYIAIFGKNTARAIDILAARLGLSMVKVSKATVRPPREPSIPVLVTMPNGQDYTLIAAKEKMREFILDRMHYYEERMGEFVKFYNYCLDLFEKSIRPSQKEGYQTYLNYVKQIRQGYDPVSMKEMVKYCNLYELKTIIPVLPQPLRTQFKDTRSVVKYYQLKVQGEALGRILGKLRSQCHVDMIPHVGLEDLIDTAKKKTIIFTSYVDVVKATGAYLEKAGYHPVLVYGETNKDVNTLIKRYFKEVDLNPIIATYDSLSTAIPITAANTLIMMNAPFRDYEYIQAVSRADRHGQDTEVIVYDVTLDTAKESNISTRSQDIMTWSKEQVSLMMGLPVQPDAEVALECFNEPNVSIADREIIYQLPHTW